MKNTRKKSTGTRTPTRTPPPKPLGMKPGGIKPGRNATINDIARLASVSKKTVSRVINQSPLVQEATRARIQAVIDKFGYVPDPQARGLAFRKSFLIGLVYDNPNAQYIVNLMEGVLDAVRNTEYEVVVHPCDRKKPDFVDGVRRFAERQKLRGAILLPPISENDELTRALSSADCAYVRITYTVLDDPARMVISNDRLAVAEVANYLISLGHKRIGYIAGPPGFRSAVERLAGFREALASRSIPLPDELIVEGGYTYESGVAGGEKLLALNPRPTAIFASNDEMAAGVYRVANKLGLSIPGDLSIVGFDDGPLASRLLPSLTTIRLPIRELGRLAANKILHPEAAGGTHSMVTPLEPHLVIRDSCQPPSR
jgi:LacI family transcriptional regulator, galactose operon repressor